jgi:cytochrome b involved in lipid metabolism
MKNIITISLIVFVVAVFIILGGAVLTNQNKSAQNPQTTVQTPAPSATYSVSDVAKHNSAGDCWVIVNNKVYNATSIIPGHPGGAQAITPLCGKDATTAFETKGGRGSHSPKAQDVMAQHLIGSIQ